MAPAGSGKTTTLVARVAWLVASGTPPGAIAAITFNVRAAEELRARLAVALEPLGVESDAVRVRTFHALGREILADSSVDVAALVDRATVLRRLWPHPSPGVLRRADDAISRLKLDRGMTLETAERTLATGPRDAVLRAFAAYERSLRDAGELDFDDLVVRSVAVLEADAELLARWRAQTADLLVDEVQDVDRTQLRLALLLAAPANRIFLVGDDDQTIYGWRLADVRRVLALDRLLPGLGRVDLVTNYRCPAPVVERAVRLVGHNRERFDKAIRARPNASGRLVLAPDAADDPVRVRRVMEAWPTEEGTTYAVLARTNAELLPAADAALALGRPFRSERLRLLVDDPRLDGLLTRARALERAGESPLLALDRLRRDALEAASAVTEARDAGTEDETDTPLPALLAALLAWAPPYRSIEALVAAIADRRTRLAELRRDDAPLTLATIHGTKGLEFDHVLVVGMEDGRFPNDRSVEESAEPARALEEERRLAYVAWTRARRTLTVSFDPNVPSRFLREAFDPGELGVAA